MAQVYLNKQFNQVTVNNETLLYDFDLENNMPPTAEEVKWNGNNGWVKRTDGSVDQISDLSEFQTLVDLYQANKNWIPFDQAKQNKRIEISTGFENELATPYSYSGFDINPSYANWSYLMHLIQGSEMFNQNTVDFWDWYNTERNIPIATAKDLLKKLMINYRTLDKKKRALLKDIEDIADDDFDSINAITW